MQLDRHTQTDQHLQNLIQRARYWQQLDQKIKHILPANLRDHLQTACIEDGQLIIHAHLPMAAGRLKMLLPVLLPKLQQLDSRIMHVQIKMQPKNPPAERSKNFRITPDALNHFQHSAEQLAHHPQLAQALLDLIRHHRHQPKP